MGYMHILHHFKYGTWSIHRFWYCSGWGWDVLEPVLSGYQGMIVVTFLPVNELVLLSFPSQMTAVPSFQVLKVQRLDFILIPFSFTSYLACLEILLTSPSKYI